MNAECCGLTDPAYKTEYVESLHVHKFIPVPAVV